ncbi:MAG: type II toxin-antitoxin system MqsA family antitoxin [Chloroflexi bacterium]|nr:type II toxin-antitoxin system MqsA family antitoxin [Chloroflexota bacterium]
MNCIICRQAEFVDGFTSIPLERGEFKLMIDHVPAQVCPNCGEALVEEEVATRVLSLAENIIAEGIFEDIRDYSK